MPRPDAPLPSLDDDPPPPLAALVVVGGPPGAGKTTLGYALCAGEGPDLPGLVLPAMRTDLSSLRRKRLEGRSLVLEVSTADLLQPAKRARVGAEIERLAGVAARTTILTYRIDAREVARRYLRRFASGEGRPLRGALALLSPGKWQRWLSHRRGRDVALAYEAWEREVLAAWRGRVPCLDVTSPPGEPGRFVVTADRSR